MVLRDEMTHRHCVASTSTTDRYIVYIPGTDRRRPASEHQQIKYLKLNEGLTDVPGLITEEVRLTINPCLAYGHAWQVSKRVHCTVQLE